MSPGKSVIVRIRPLILITAIFASLVLLTIGCTCAQENPFGGGARADRASEMAKPAASTEPPEISADAPQTARLLVRSVKQSDPKSPVELAKAVKVMLDVRQFEFARFYLTQLMAASQEPAERADLVRELGNDFFFTLHATPELAPEGREFSSQMLAFNRRFRQSPEQLQRLIVELNNKDIALRSRAFRRLRRLGPAAIAELIEVFADPSQKNVFPGVRGALRGMGDEAIPLLRAAAVANHQGVRIEALRALAHYRGEGVADVLGAAAISAIGDARIRKSVALAMQDNNYQIPVPADLVSRLKCRAEGLLAGDECVRGSLAPTMEVWVWDADSKELQPVLATLATASRYEAARLAAEAYAIEPRSNQLRQLYLVGQLEIAKRSRGTEGANSVVRSEDFFAGLLPTIGEVSVRELNDLLKMAVSKKAVSAAIACCELLAELGQDDAADVFHSAGNQMPPVVLAMMLGDRHLQFAALNVVDKLRPATAYPGSSLAVRLAVFLARTNQRSVGLVGHHRLEVAQSIAGSLFSAGMAGNSAATSKKFFDAAVVDPDVSLLLISDTLSRPRFEELVRQLRSDFRTARTPIGLMVRDIEQDRMVARLIEADPLTYAFPVEIDGPALVAHIDRASHLVDADLARVAVGDRYRYAEAAANWLVKISSDRQMFGFYQLGPYQKQLAGLLYNPGLEQAASQILANLGTPLAQRELANFASQNSNPTEKRRVAAESLGRSIEAGSALLTRGEIKRQYDRYNASETEPEESREILGSILDSFEQQRSRMR